MTKLIPVLWLGGTLLLAGCSAASSGVAGEGGGVASTPSSDAYTTDIGTASLVALERAVPFLLNKHGYAVERQERGGDEVEFETGWTTRPVVAAEAAGGARDAMTKLVIAGRMRGEYYAVRLEARNQVRSAADGNWAPAPVTPEVRRMLGRLVSDLRSEFDTGVRRY